MKKLFIIMVLLFQAHVSYAAFDVPHVLVFGTAEKEVSPDEIRWGLNVRTEGGATEVVSENHISEVTNVLNVLHELGQTEDSVTTTNMQLNEHWIYRNNSRQKQGYFASTTIRFISNDFATYVNYWTKLSALKSVSVSGVSFGVSNKSEIEDDVKVMAIAQARRKAERFATALGTSLGAPLQIEELNGGNLSPLRSSRAVLMESDGGGQPVSPGKQLIDAQVKVVFSIK